jgi:hypothetical protein
MATQSESPLRRPWRNIILGETFSHFARAHSHNSVLAEIGLRRPSKYIYSDQTLLQVGGFTRERLFHDMLKELLTAPAAVESGTR